MSPALEIGSLLTLFGMIIAVYVWTDKKTQETDSKVKRVEDCVEGKLTEMQKDITEIKLGLARDLTRIKTKLGIDKD